MVHQLWETAKESLTAYTGLSPATFFKVLAVVFPLYYLVLNLFRYSDDGRARHGGEFEEEKQLLRSPVQLGEITEEELKQYDGSDPKMPLLMAIKGQIYDVSQSRMFYGPGGPYALFSGKDASRALAKVSFEEKDLNGNLTGLSVFELEALQDWEHKFMSKYIKVGTVKTTMRANNGAPEREAREAVKVGTVKTTVRASNGASEREARKAVKVGTIKDVRARDGAPERETKEAVKVGSVKTTIRASDGAPKWEPREAVKVGTVRTTVRASDGAPERGAREAAETDAAKPAEAVSGDVAKLAEDYLWESATKEAEELLVMLRKRSDFLT